MICNKLTRCRWVMRSSSLPSPGLVGPTYVAANTPVCWVSVCVCVCVCLCLGKACSLTFNYKLNIVFFLFFFWSNSWFCLNWWTKYLCNICLFKLLCELSVFKCIENIVFVMDLEMDSEHTPSISIGFVFYLYIFVHQRNISQILCFNTF